MSEVAPAVRIAVDHHRDATVVLADGVLDSSSYHTIRDSVIKAALDEPCAVIVDVNRLGVPSQSAWTVFTSARWHVSVWPDVPILLVCAAPQARRAIAAGGVARYVPVHPTLEQALDAVRGQSIYVRRRARSELPRSRASIGYARTVVTDWLTEWGGPELIPVAATVATVFVENVLDHTESAPALILESYSDAITVAVEDASPELPGRREDSYRGAEIVSGLAIVSALGRVWGSMPTPSGKIVWAVVGRENRL